MNHRREIRGRVIADPGTPWASLRVEAWVRHDPDAARIAWTKVHAGGRFVLTLPHRGHGGDERIYFEITTAIAVLLSTEGTVEWRRSIRRGTCCSFSRPRSLRARAAPVALGAARRISPPFTAWSYRRTPGRSRP
jgi:hypothetical protein